MSSMCGLYGIHNGNRTADGSRRRCNSLTSCVSFVLYCNQRQIGCLAVTVPIKSESIPVIVSIRSSRLLFCELADVRCCRNINYNKSAQSNLGRAT